jgi:hypothetical protein
MKTTDPRDPLDHKIDALLASRPLKADRDFTARVLAATEAAEAQTTTAHFSSKLLRFALPLAAVFALAFSLIQFTSPKPTKPTEPTALSAADMQEIFLLEEGLTSLALLQDDSLGNGDLLTTLEALYFDIQS